jgi:hypothetical protein
MPSLKYSVSASELRFEIGRTAIDSSGVAGRGTCAAIALVLADRSA